MHSVAKSRRLREFRPIALVAIALLVCASCDHETNLPTARIPTAPVSGAGLPTTAAALDSPNPAPTPAVAPTHHGPGDSVLYGGGRPGEPVTGTVYYDRNQNGKQDPGEPGIPNVVLYLASSNTPAREEIPSTHTDAHGHFTLIPPDRMVGRRLQVRTGWFRTQCPGLYCNSGGPGDNVLAGPEWIYSAPITGATAHTFNIGLIPDAGQYVVDKKSKFYSGYPPNLANAHRQDLEVRFTDDEGKGCVTTTNGVTCHLGQTIYQTMYIANGGLTPVGGIQGVMELPYGEVHHTLQLLRSDTSPGITGITIDSVVPATVPVPPRPLLVATADSYTTIRFTLHGVLPPAGIIAVFSTDTLASGLVGTQIVGRAGITAEDNASADTDSAFCQSPAVAGTCSAVSDTHSFLDLSGDDNDSDRFNIIA